MELNRTGVETFNGYLHPHDSYQWSFLHKTSSIKFNIPYDNPLFGLNPNTYEFQIRSKMNQEPQAKHCIKSEDLEDASDLTDCYIKHLGELIGCDLPWQNDDDSSKQLYCTIVKVLTLMFNFLSSMGK